MATSERPGGHCAVDIRLFLLTLVVSMTGAFFAGVSFVPPQFFIDSMASLAKSNTKLQVPKSLDLSKADLFTSNKHSPSGQHLLVDIKGIEAAFLDSEERLADAMIRTVEAGGLSMLSYHCHKLDPAGISCVGILLESHISFHTWPEEGVITLDLFTCGANPLLPVVPVIEHLFGIGENIETKWSHDLRGFRSIEERRKNYLDDMSDLSFWLLSPLDVLTKNMVYSNLTKYQRVDIWDIAEREDKPTYADGLKHNLSDEDPRWYDPHYFTPDRMLFLDGTIQSIASSENEYHEALVHPAMFAHPKPLHVGIIGGGEGATLREVLKHKTINHVTMVEIDDELIEIAREYLPKMSDCSDLEGRAANCFDDELVEVVHENGVEWFEDRFGPGATKTAPDTPFDCIIVDALDPEDEVPFTKDLYVDEKFVSSIMKSLSKDGVIIIQIGTAPELSDPKADVGMYQVREQFFNMFEVHPDVGAVHVFEEHRSGFFEPHSFMVICKDAGCRKRWYADSDATEYEIYDRIVGTKSGEAALKFYDGITQVFYQYPTMSWEAVYCRREPMPFECAYRSLDFAKEVFELDLVDEEKSSFSVDLGEKKVLAKVDIPKGSYIMPGSLASSLILREESMEGVKEAAKRGSQAFSALNQFLESHGHKSHTVGEDVRFLEVGASVLIREVDDEAEANVGRWVPIHPDGKRPAFSPVYDRHRASFDLFMIATKDIPAGSEITRFKDVWVGGV